jgi:hypothetical protein
MQKALCIPATSRCRWLLGATSPLGRSTTDESLAYRLYSFSQNNPAVLLVLSMQHFLASMRGNTMDCRTTGLNEPQDPGIEGKLILIVAISRNDVIISPCLITLHSVRLAKKFYHMLRSRLCHWISASCLRTARALGKIDAATLYSELATESITMFSLKQSVVTFHSQCYTGSSLD